VFVFCLFFFNLNECDVTYFFFLEIEKKNQNKAGIN